jgi:hypothetical protein
VPSPNHTPDPAYQNTEGPVKRTLFVVEPLRPEERPRFVLDDYQREVLIRIRRNCDQLKAVLRQLREDRDCRAFIDLSVKR